MTSYGGFFMITKKELRKELIEQRKNLSSDYRHTADNIIIHKIIESKAYQEAHIIFCFVSMEDEINTKPIIEHALSTGKCVAVPKCIEKGIMHAYQITSFDDLGNGKYGILEPKKHCQLIKASDIDFAIVPCLSCNSEGYRIGYGGGYYDRYLSNLSCETAVVCYCEMMRENIPVEAFDVKIDILITD